MTTSALKITTVHKTIVPAMASPKGFVCIPMIELATSPQLLTVKGTGFTPRTKQDVLCCTLARSGKNDREAVESVWMATRFAHKCDEGSAENWTVEFDVLDAAIYFFTCHAFNNGDAQVMIKIDKVEKSVNGLLSFNPDSPTFSPKVISASGMVLSDSNPVSCCLTPINCNTGTSTGPVACKSATMTGKDWSVTFTGTYSGCYLLQAAAASEGTIHCSVEL